MVIVVVLLFFMLFTSTGCQSTIYENHMATFKSEEIGYSYKKFGNNNINFPKYYVIMSNGIVLLTDTLYKVGDSFVITKIEENAYE